jgi:hypothetical protein
MSLFSGVFNPLPYLQEKTLAALVAAVELIDLANEPDTTEWYKRNLTKIASAIIDRLVPVVALVHSAGEEAAGQSRAMIDGGSFALTRWCKKYKIGDSRSVGKLSVADLKLASELEEKSEEIETPQFDGEWQDLKLSIYNSMCSRLLYDELPIPSQKFLLWLMRGLWISDPPDVVRISKRFLPTDIGISREDAAQAYRLLHEHGIIERVIDKADDGEKRDSIKLRLVVQGVNDSRHPPEFTEEEFGYPGARIRGQVTSGQTVLLPVPETIAERLQRWFKEERNLPELRNELQSTFGEDRIFVENAKIKCADDEPMVEIQFRYPLEDELEALDKELKEFAKKWLTKNLETIFSS